MKNHVIGRFMKGLLILTLCHLQACGEVKINRGPFPIDFDEKKNEAKTTFLEKAPGKTGEGSLPNIVLILLDDLGKNDISIYDPDGVQTPCIEMLAQHGVRFSSAYTTSSLCSPSRAGLLTGRYQHRFGFERQPMNRYPRGKFEFWIVDKWIDTAPMELLNPMAKVRKDELEKQGIPPGELLLSEVLKTRGYRTGIFGKWHLGYHETFIPGRRGFDEQYGFYEAFTHYASESDPEIINYKHDYFANKHIWRQKRKGSCAIRENDSVIDENQYLTFAISDHACQFIDRNRDSPFFLYVPFSAPHTPFQVPKAYYDRFSDVHDENKRVYYGMISAVDDAIKTIIEKLEEHDLIDNTLIVFASDNGGASYTGATDNGILKAGKFSQFEGGINVPMIFSWRGVIDEGTVYPHPVSLMDIFATVTAISGCDLPGDRPYDGKNLIPYLAGEMEDQPHPCLFWRTDFNNAVLDGGWKLIWNDRDDQIFLYNLTEDPSEKEDLSLLHHEKVELLKNKFLEWEEMMVEPLWPGVMQFRFEIDGETTWWAI